MPYALVVGSAIFELFDQDPGFAPGLTVVEVAADAQVGWVSTDGAAFAAPVAAPVSVELALAALDAHAQVVEASGVLFQAQGARSPSLMLTDVASQGKLTSAFVASSAGLWAAGTPWKMADGTFVPLSNADVISAASHALAYVAACATAEAALAVQVRANPALDVTAAGLWPSNGPFAAPAAPQTASATGTTTASGQEAGVVPVSGAGTGDGEAEGSAAA